MTDDGWTSLEIARLVVGALTPLVVAVIGYYLNRATRRAEQDRREVADRLERAERDAAARAEAARRESARLADETEWRSRRAIDRLVELHREMAPLINDIFCVTMMVGHFRDIDPPAVIRKKRELDRLFFVNEYLFDPGFRERYLDFQHACFEQWANAGRDSLIRVSARRLRLERGGMAWEDDWWQLFSEKLEGPGGSELTAHQQEAYVAVMRDFAAQLGLGHFDVPSSWSPSHR